MSIIISNSEFQKNIGKISRSIDSKPYIVTSHGKANMVVLPYFEDGDDLINEYIEDYEMAKNHAKLKAKYKKSSEEGDSNLVI